MEPRDAAIARAESEATGPEPDWQAAPEPDWQAAPPFRLRGTLPVMLRCLWTLHAGPVIVETGALRNDLERGRETGGWSTLTWGWFCSQTGGRLYLVEGDAGAMAAARRITAEWAAAIEYVEGDPVAFLQSWPGERGRIDLLHLNSLEWIDRARSQARNLAEAAVGLPHLAARSLVLIDETYPAWMIEAADGAGVPPFAGKGTRTVPFLRSRGFRVEWYGDCQVLLARGGNEAELAAAVGEARAGPP